MKEILVKGLDLKKTFTCGQCFRWYEQPDGSFKGIVGVGREARAASIAQTAGEAGTLITGYEDWMYEYLDLGTDYAAIQAELASRDEVIRDAIKVGDGIRILKQPLWETIVSFIISQNNNIPRIQGCIERLAMALGGPETACIARKNEFDGKSCFGLPTPEKLANATLKDLEPVRLGYRAPYLIEAARHYLENPDRPLNEYMGVGPKVANCIALFGKHELDAFPIDVWVKRVMHELYGFDESDVRGMADFAKEKFSPYGGIAQQYLFYYIREKNASSGAAGK